MRMQTDAPIAISFDEAMNQEFVNVALDEEGNPIAGAAQVKMDRTDYIGDAIDGTPVGTPTQTNENWN